MTFKRMLMAGATAFISVNIWTGAPLLALWIGSRVVGGSVLSMEAVFVVVAVLATLVFTMAIALAWLNARYNHLTGQSSGRSQLSWLRSMNASEDELLDEEEEVGSSAPERIVVGTVYVAVIALLVWFFAFAGSPLPN